MSTRELQNTSIFCTQAISTDVNRPYHRLPYKLPNLAQPLYVQWVPTTKVKDRKFSMRTKTIERERHRELMNYLLPIIQVQPTTYYLGTTYQLLFRYFLPMYYYLQVLLLIGTTCTQVLELNGTTCTQVLLLICMTCPQVLLLIVSTLTQVEGINWQQVSSSQQLLLLIVTTYFLKYYNVIYFNKMYFNTGGNSKNASHAILLSEYF